MMMALAGMRDLPCVLVPGGVTLPPTRRRGRRQGPDRSAPASPTARSRCEEAAELGCRACASPGRRLPVPRHRGDRRRSSARRSACRCRTRRWPRRASRSGSTWPARSARALVAPGRRAGSTTRDILTDAAVRNAMVVHAAFGGSTNLLLHIPAIAHAAGLRAADRRRLDRRQPPGAAPGRRAAQRPGRPPDRARLPRRRRARGDAAPARRSGCSTETVLTVDGRAARATCSTGGRARERRRAAARACCATRTASTPTT